MLSDRFGRDINYVRVSVTDRCDFRCVYCMDALPQFAARTDQLSLEEHYEIVRAFVQLGVTKVRLTGGEPLVREGLIHLAKRIRDLPGLQELAITTNGSRLSKYALPLQEAGVDSVNISLDTLQRDRFRQLTNVDKLPQVLAGIHAAIHVGFRRIRLNSVIVKGMNDGEIIDLVQFAVDNEIDIAFIEQMPLGNMRQFDRATSFYNNERVYAKLRQRFTLDPSPDTTRGPARYWCIANTNTRIGLISPYSDNFCHLCNRVRLTSTGRLLLCLGQENAVDLRHVLRENPACLQDTIVDAMAAKPKGHDFYVTSKPVVMRYMNMTGG